MNGIFGEAQADVEAIIKELQDCQTRMQEQIVKMNLAILEANIRIGTHVTTTLIKGCTTNEDDDVQSE